MNSTTEKHMARGVAWAFATRWTLRLIGLFSIVIMARLLEPEDFGVVAMCTIVTGLISSFSTLGVGQLFIREPDSSRDACNTAWTIMLLQSVFVAMVIMLSAPLAVQYFEEPRLTGIFNLLALSALVGGFSNIGILLARKQLIFNLEFRLTVVGRVSKFIATVALAFLLQDYRAIVYGTLISACIVTVYSYFLHPYRPGIELKFAKRYMRFAASIIPQRLGEFLYKRLDVIVVGGAGSASTLGVYNVASQLPHMAAFEVALPVSKGLYPNYAKLTEKPTALVHAFLQGLAVTMAIVLPIAGGLWILSNEFIHVVFGSKWAEAVWFLEWLSLYAALECVCYFMSHQILIVTGHEKRAAIFTWVKLAILSVLLFTGFHFSGIEGIAIARVMGAGLSVILSIVLLINSVPVTLSQIAAALWRPMISVGLMVGALSYIDILTSIDSMLLKLILFSIIGAIIYGLGLILFWIGSGRPPGLENYIVKLAMERFSLLRKSA